MPEEYKQSWQLF